MVDYGGQPSVRRRRGESVAWIWSRDPFVVVVAGMIRLRRNVEHFSIDGDANSWFAADELS